MAKAACHMSNTKCTQQPVTVHRERKNEWRMHDMERKQVAKKNFMGKKNAIIKKIAVNQG